MKLSKVLFSYKHLKKNNTFDGKIQRYQLYTMLKSLCRGGFPYIARKVYFVYSSCSSIILHTLNFFLKAVTPACFYRIPSLTYLKMTNVLRRHRPLIFLLSALLFCSSCSMRYRNALFTSKDDPARDSIKSVYVVNSTDSESILYRIKPNDLLAVRNLQDIRYISAPADGNSNITTGTGNITYRVEADGTVALPVIGKVEVAGLKRSEAAEKIQAMYEKSLLKDPIIDVSIVNLKVTMLGEFISQGNFLLEKDNTSLVEMIGQAGGISSRADPKKLKIIRGDPQDPEIIYVNLKDINSLASKKLILQNNDIIYLEPQAVYGNQERTQIFTSFVQPVLLVLNTALLIYNFSTR